MVHYTSGFLHVSCGQHPSVEHTRFLWMSFDPILSSKRFAAAETTSLHLYTENGWGFFRALT